MIKVHVSDTKYSFLQFRESKIEKQILIWL